MKLWGAALGAAFAFFIALAPAGAAPKFPSLTGRVVDDAHILSAQTNADLTGKLAALEAKTSRQLVVVTLPSLQGYEIADYGYQLGRAWGIGQKKLDNGAILIVAPNEHKVRIEVGYGLEPVLTDALSEVIIQTQMLPKFRGGDYNSGVEAGVGALIAQLSLDPSAAEAKAAAAEAQVRQPGGGGVSPFFVFLAVFFVFALIRHAATGRGTGFGLWPLLFLAGGPRSGGNWSGGGFGGGGFGGGFGGGGGSFGGGGASGSW